MRSQQLQRRLTSTSSSLPGTANSTIGSSQKRSSLYLSFSRAIWACNNTLCSPSTPQHNAQSKSVGVNDVTPGVHSEWTLQQKDNTNRILRWSPNWLNALVAEQKAFDIISTLVKQKRFREAITELEAYCNYRPASQINSVYWVTSQGKWRHFDDQFYRTELKEHQQTLRLLVLFTLMLALIILSSFIEITDAHGETTRNLFGQIDGIVHGRFRLMGWDENWITENDEIETLVGASFLSVAALILFFIVGHLRWTRLLRTLYREWARSHGVT